jgi:hypothetical protein
VLSKGLIIPVSYVFGDIGSRTIGNTNVKAVVEVSKRPTAPEYLYALVKVRTNLTDDQVCLSILLFKFY